MREIKHLSSEVKHNSPALMACNTVRPAVLEA